MATSKDLVAVGSCGKNYMTTTVAAADDGKNKFRICLKDVDDVTKDTSKEDVAVSCPPDNKDGYLIIAVNDIIRCQRGPGFPETDEHRHPEIKIDTKKQSVTITLQKAVPGKWIRVWNDLV